MPSNMLVSNQGAVKDQLISKTNCQAVNSSIIRTNDFVFTCFLCIFVRFLEEIEDTKKTFRNYLTFILASRLSIDSHNV